MTSGNAGNETKKHIAPFNSVVTLQCNLQMAPIVFIHWYGVARSGTCHPSLFYVKGGGKDKKNGLFKQWDLHSLPLC